ncbi:MAG: CubicO group peptidase (beta-lactamase class C family), partial [Planctomycetota bacterium]
AVYRDGLGATRDPAVELQLPEFLAEPLAALDPDRHWPIGSSSLLATTAKDVDAALLAAAINRPFEEEGGTHAIVVIHRGELIFERYAPGYTLDTPLMGWSLTKSVTATLAGRLVKEGRLDVDAPAPVAEWEGDSRRSITLDDLLRMRSGLAFHQDHSTPFCDSLQMLFVSKDCAGYARDMPLAGEPGETWMYSDGTANIVAGIVSAAFSDDLIERLQAPRKLLFGPLGMTTAFIGVDGAGNFVGSSFMYASARDWARFGLLYAQDGVWDGERLLPEGWASYVANPPQDSAERGYGAHFWRYDNGPIRGVYFARGYQGQYVFVDPLRDVVLVRLGVELVEFDGRAFAEATLAAFPSR